MRSYINTIFLKLIQIIVLVFSVFGFWLTVELSFVGKIKIDDFSSLATSLGTFFGGIATFFGVCIAALAFERWKEQAKHAIHYKWIIDAIILLNEYESKSTVLILSLNSFHKDNEIKELYAECCQSCENIVRILNRIDLTHIDSNVAYYPRQSLLDLKNLIRKSSNGELEGTQILEVEEVIRSNEMLCSARAELEKLKSYY